MKIRKTLLLTGILLPLLFSSCGLFNGGKGCDCPKFSQETELQKAEPENNAITSNLE